ncbi:type II secretion system protein [Vibrio jasicida]|uniref:type II secretion system protein n=1 Tax=Vibrio jasicida TaxID=766224 RepID=UPI000CE352CE|nr:type II secretion system protein [Vibrio jasicida]
MKRQGGFTLIELVVVIVILGILAVTAAPRFLNLQSDARESALQGLKGAIDGASGIVFGKSAIEGKESKNIDALANGITTSFGYPQSEKAGLVDAVSGLNQDWAWAATAATSSAQGTLVATFPAGALVAGENSGKASDIEATNCYVKYTTAADSDVGNEASTVITSDDC